MYLIAIRRQGRETKISSSTQFSILLFCTCLWKKSLVLTGIAFLDFCTIIKGFRINFIWLSMTKKLCYIAPAIVNSLYSPRTFSSTFLTSAAAVCSAFPHRLPISFACNIALIFCDYQWWLHPSGQASITAAAS